MSFLQVKSAPSAGPVDNEAILADIRQLKANLEHPFPPPGADVLSSWVQFFTYFEVRGLQAIVPYSKMYLETLGKCVMKFIKNPTVINDRRYVEIVLKHVESFEDVPKRIRLNGALMGSGVGKTVASIYIKQSQEFEMIQDYGSACDIIRKGIGNNAQPLPVLEEYLKDLECCLAQNVITNMERQGQGQAENSIGIGTGGTVGGNSRNFGLGAGGTPAPTMRPELNGGLGQGSSTFSAGAVHIPFTAYQYQSNINILNDDQENGNGPVGPGYPEFVVPPPPRQAVVHEFDKIGSELGGKWTNPEPEHKFTVPLPVPVIENMEKIQVYESFSEEIVPFEKYAITKPVLQDRKLVDEPQPMILVTDPQLFQKGLDKSASSLACTGAGPSSLSNLPKEGEMDNYLGLGGSKFSSVLLTKSTSRHFGGIPGPQCTPFYSNPQDLKPIGVGPSFSEFKKPSVPRALSLSGRENAQINIHPNNSKLTDTVVKTEVSEPEFKKPEMELLPELPPNCKLICGIDRVMKDGEEISFEEIRARRFLRIRGPPPPFQKQKLPIEVPTPAPAVPPAAIMMLDDKITQKIQALLVPTLKTITTEFGAKFSQMKLENEQLQANYNQLIHERQNDTMHMNMILNHYQQEVQKLITQFQQQILGEGHARDTRILVLYEKTGSVEEFINELSIQVQTLNARVAVVMSQRLQTQKSTETGTGPAPAEPKLPIHNHNSSSISIRNGSIAMCTTPNGEADLTNKNLLTTTACPDMDMDSQFFDNGNYMIAPTTSGAFNIPPPEPTVAIFKQPLDNGEVDFNMSNLTKSLFCNPHPLNSSTPQKKLEPKSNGTGAGRSLFNQTLADVGQNLSTIRETSREYVSSSGSSGSGGQQTIGGTRGGGTSTFSSTKLGSYSTGTGSRSRYTMPGHNPFSHE